MAEVSYLLHSSVIQLRRREYTHICEKICIANETNLLRKCCNRLEKQKARRGFAVTSPEDSEVGVLRHWLYDLGAVFSVYCKEALSDEPVLRFDYNGTMSQQL